jgi:1,4-alpha-glucan branching enzyme
VEFVFVAPGARNVSLVGDFNGWDAAATPMRRTDGRTTWSVALRLPAGRHVYAFVIDGDAWVADPQAPLAPEQWFGQRNSVVIVASAGDRRL